jgi:Bacterial membrane protein YfhO
MTTFTKKQIGTSLFSRNSQIACSALNTWQSLINLDSLEKRLLCTALVTAAFMFGILSWPLLTGQVSIKTDLGAYYLPIRFFYAESLAQGEISTWFPNILNGFYLHGEGHGGMYHPLHLFLYTALPLAMAFNLELFLNFPMILAGTFCLFRRWGLRADAALFGALCFSFSGFNLLHLVHPNAVAIVAHIPWILLAIDIVMRTDSHRRLVFAKISVALLTTSQLLLGHPQYLLLSTFVEFLYIVFVASLWGGWRRWLSVGEAKFLGVLGGCIQLIPTWEVLSNSWRADPPLAFRYSWSLHPANLVQFVAPYVFSTRVAGGNTHEFGLYPGAIATVLALWLLIRFRELNFLRRQLVLGAFSLGVLALILAMGEHGYLYRVQAHLPLIGVFRVPARYILLVHFAMAVAAAVAFIDLAELSERGNKLSWYKLWPLALVPMASLLAAGFALWSSLHPDPTLWIVAELAKHVASPFYVLIGAAVLLLATLIVIAAARKVRFALVSLIVFASVDQVVYGLSYIWFSPGLTTINSFVNSQLMPPGNASHRVQFYKAYNNVATMKGFRQADGYAALFPKTRLDSGKYARLRVASVRWFQTPEGNWSQVESPLPRARLVTKIVVSSRPNEDIDNIDLESTALVEDTLQLQEGNQGEAYIISDRPGKIELNTTATSRQLLVLSESYHVGWQAKIDGESCRVLRVYGDFMGCVVNAGVHIVEFNFNPQSLRLGSWISVLGVGLIVLSFCLGNITRSSNTITLK